MKKVGIITIVNVNNYGAELQAFALQHYVSKLDYNCEIIDYVYYKNRKHIATKRSKPFVKLSLKQKIKETLYPIISEIKSLPYKAAKKNRENHFKTFHKNNTNFSKKYPSMDALYNAKLDYDIYIVGSDQVWNPNTNSCIEPYFLTFAPSDKLKLSFASSFGVDSIPVPYHNTYKNYLANLDNISVREKQGVSLVDAIAERESEWVLDPTFLFNKNEWLQYAELPLFDKPFLLMYVLTDSELITKMAYDIAKAKNLEIVKICKNASVEDKNTNILNIIDAGPAEYLGWFSKASYVLTTSFHGTCFSLNFNISFNVILKKNKSNNGRQTNLLKEVGLEDRVVYVGDDKFQTNNIDYIKVNQNLDIFRENSKDFLKKSLRYDL